MGGKQLQAYVAGAMLFSLLLVRLQPCSAAVGFIRVSNGRFVDENCQDFVAAGLNTWQLMDVAAGKVKSSPVQTGNGLADVVQWTLATAASNHLTVLRIFGHGVDPAFPLQYKPGKYNEQAFQALDYILDEASKVGVRVLLTMADNWSPVDSKQQYVQWSPTARGSALNVLSHGFIGETGVPDAFFTDETCRKQFKDHMAAMVSRRNSINGKLYRDDPTIFAWDLMNEPRCDCFPDSIPAPPELVSCRPECTGKMQRWIEEMASHLKSLDPKHMVTVGEEGFYGPGSAGEPANPGTGWATITGQNFTANHAPASIDFAACHLYVDNWGIWDLEFLSQWIRQHAADARALGKPLMIEEFGKQVHIETPHKSATSSSIRAPFYRRVYNALLESLEKNDALRGVIFWQFGFEPYVSNAIFGNCRHCEAIQVTASDTIFTNVISPAAEKAAKMVKTGPLVAGCSPVSTGDRAPIVPHPLLAQLSAATSAANVTRSSGVSVNTGSAAASDASSGNTGKSATGDSSFGNTGKTAAGDASSGGANKRPVRRPDQRSKRRQRPRQRPAAGSSKVL